MQHLDEGTIHTWIDGELSPEQASEVEAHVRDCASCAAMVAEARGLVAASTRILTALDHVPGGVLPSVPDIAPAQAARRRWYQRTDVRAAAALLFVAGTSLVVVQSRTDLRGTKAMIATADNAAMPSSSTGAEKAGVGAAEGVQQGMADAQANASPQAAAPEQRFEAAGGARNRSLQSKVMADDRAAASAARHESQLSKEEVAKRRAADIANAPSALLRIDAAAPAPPPPAAASAGAAAPAPPTEVRSRLDIAGGSVEGRVTEKRTGQALANAQVLVDGTTLSATTDKDGKFRIENVPPGSQRLRVRRIGYTAEAVPITIDEGKVAAAQIGIGETTTQLSEVVVTSVPTAPVRTSAGAAVSKSVAAAPLRVVRTDSTSGTKRTVYEVSQGVEVTLTESPADTAERDNAAFDRARQKAAAPQRTEAVQETPRVLSGQVAGAKPAPPAAPMPPPYNTISWTDRAKRYTLSGWLTVKDLEAIKARLIQMRR